MQKRHFEDAAEIVRNILNGEWTHELPVWGLGHAGPYGRGINADISDLNMTRAIWTAEAFISLFGDANPRFDTQRFLIACGLAEKPAKKAKR